jgi:ABC-2 type transport system ATP-binding protein
MLAVGNLSRGFGDRPVLTDLSFAVAPGERLALHGPNGSGKTTLLRCVLGTLTPDAGSIAVDGHAAGTPAARRLTGASLAQERSFYLRLSGRENLRLFARLRGAPLPAVDALVDELGLHELVGQRADRCSTGQLQQLALARALLGEPPLLLLDEPTRSLDTEARDRLWAALDRRPQTTVLFATHLDADLSHTGRVLELGAT